MLGRALLSLVVALGGAVCAAQPLLRPADAAAAGMSGEQLKAAAAILEREVRAGSVPAAAILVARGGRIVLNEAYGRMGREAGSAPVTPESVFLLASITKPVTACAVMRLVDAGRISLDDPASYYLGEFKGDGREQIRVRDLLRHTSGLPDMLPENIELRRAHAPLSEFVRRAMTTPLLYKPGTGFQYQSMGILLAGEIVERASGMRLGDFMKQEIFEPLGMNSSSLGLGGRAIHETVFCCEPPGDPADEARFGPNTDYWRDMGHPWGGMHSTTGDLALLLQTMLNEGVYAGRRVFSRAAVRAMTRNQNPGTRTPWGLGWALAESPVWAYFGELVSPDTFGHVGATGTVAWADPVTETLCVILTNRSVSADGGRLLRLVSNAVAAAVDR